jgi:histidinol-phosphate aminotransferase
MSFSRRQFLKNTSISAAAVPLVWSQGIDYCEATTDAAFDFSMGNPKGAIRLNFNENVLGPSPKAIAGATAGIPESYRYAIGGLLRPLFAEHHGLDKEWILPGTGSTEIQRLAPMSHLQDGGNVVSTLETWQGLLTVADNMGAPVKRVKLLEEKGYAYDIKGLLEAVDSNTKIFLMITPNNPTGTSLTYEELKGIADALPTDVLFVIDEAYSDYHPDGWKTGIDLVKAGYDNVLVTRTFSKAHALAGLRCGYGVGHPDILKKIKKFGCGPGSINMAAFGAVQGALDDPAHVRQSRAYVQKTRIYYQQQAQKLGLATVSGPSPFMLIEVGERAKAIQNELKKRNIFIQTVAHLPNYLRVSYGREEENQAFIGALRESLTLY